MPRKLIPFLVGALVAVAFPVSAQKFLPKSIQFKGDPDHSTQELLAAAGLQMGAVLTPAQMNEASKRLLDSGMFSTLSFKFDGQDLIFLLTPSDQLLSVHLDNLPLAPGTDLESKLNHQFPLYHGKLPSQGDLQEQVRAAIESTLAEQGIKATVLATPASDPKTHLVDSVHFSIASPPVLVRIAQIEGESAIFQEKLQSVAEEAAKIPYDTENSASSIEQAFDNFYLDRGYAAVKVTAKRSGNPSATPQAVDVPFVVTIQEGHQYKVGSVHLPADAPVSDADISRTLNAGTPGQLQGIRIRSLWALVASHYHSKGYLDCKLTPTPHFDETAATVNYDVAVDPGPVYHLGLVKFANVSDQLRAMLMRDWQLMPGEPFDESYVAGFIMNVQQHDPALRSTLNNVKYTFDAVADPQSHDVNLVIHLARQ